MDRVEKIRGKVAEERSHGALAPNLIISPLMVGGVGAEDMEDRQNGVKIVL